MAERGRDLRAQVLAASVELITEQGLAALSLREVARRAGVSHQAPYHHFPDREAVLAAVAEEGFRLLADALTRALEGEALSATERLARAGRAYVDFAQAHPAHFRVMFRPDVVDLRQHAAAEAEADRAYHVLEALVAGTVRERAVARRHEVGMVVASWAFAHGLAALLLDGPLAKADESRAPEAQREAALAAFVALLGVEPATPRARRARARPSKGARGSTRGR